MPALLWNSAQIFSKDKNRATFYVAARSISLPGNPLPSLSSSFILPFLAYADFFWYSDHSQFSCVYVCEVCSPLHSANSDPTCIGLLKMNLVHSGLATWGFSYLLTLDRTPSCCLFFHSCKFFPAVVQMWAWLTPVPGEFNRHPLFSCGISPVFSLYLPVDLELIQIFRVKVKNVSKAKGGQQPGIRICA